MPYPAMRRDSETVVPITSLTGVHLNGLDVRLDWRSDAGREETAQFRFSSVDDARQFIAGLPITISPELAAEYDRRSTYVEQLSAANSMCWLTPAIVAVNVLVFGIMAFAGVDAVNPRPDDIAAWGVNWWSRTTAGEWWRTLTSAFLHFGILHLGMNMWALWAAGKFTERLYGTTAFGLIYLGAAIFSGLVAVWWHSHQTVIAGASGAVFGVYGALMAYLASQKESFPPGVVDALKRSTLTFVGYNVLFGLTVSGISNAGHLSGLAAGFALGLTTARPLDPARRRAQFIPRMLAGAAIAAAGVGVTAAVMPKSPVTLQAQAFLDAIESAGREETAAIEQANRLIREYTDGQLPDADFARQIEESVIPRWTRFRAVIAERPPGPGPFQPVYDQLMSLGSIRIEAFEALARGSRTNDEALTKRFNELMKQGDELVETITAGMKALQR